MEKLQFQEVCMSSGVAPFTHDYVLVDGVKVDDGSLEIEATGEGTIYFKGTISGPHALIEVYAKRIQEALLGWSEDTVKNDPR